MTNGHIDHGPYNNNSKYLEMHTQDVYIVFKVHKVKNVSVLPVFCWLPAASPPLQIVFSAGKLERFSWKTFQGEKCHSFQRNIKLKSLQATTFSLP